MTTPPSSATELDHTLVTALAEMDFDRLAETLAPDVRMRALTPPGPVELYGATVAAARFAAWFAGSELEILRFGSDDVVDRLHIFYRIRVKRPGDSSKIVEQHLFCTVDGGRIAALDLVCSGLRSEELGADGSFSAGNDRPQPAHAQSAGLPPAYRRFYRRLSIGHDAAKGGTHQRRRPA